MGLVKRLAIRIGDRPVCVGLTAWSKSVGTSFLYLCDLCALSLLRFQMVQFVEPKQARKIREQNVHLGIGKIESG